MYFIHRPFQPGETIAALATPPGEGGIGIIRISGNEAIFVAGRIFSGPVASYASHTAHLGVVCDLEGNRLDQALLLLMRAPRSYTGEDTVELQCHGGMIATRKVLEAVLSAGARAAAPGEFTFKAFMNGKLDLSQAEAVQQLIGAKSEEAFSVAGRHLDGGLSKKISGFQNELTRIAAILEAWVDFPEEGLAFASQEELAVDLNRLKRELDKLVATFHDGQKLDQGISLCIAGAPNAGKSSLMNALLEKERAIVTPIAGTTRDLLYEEMTIGGLPFRLIDTAGIRETEEMVEKEGIRRSKEALEKADLIILVIDAAKELETEERDLLAALPREKTIVVWNKADLPKRASGVCDFSYQVDLSAKEGIGMDKLKEAIDRLIWSAGAPPKDEVLITKARHEEALREASEALAAVIEGLEEGLSPEFLSADMRAALTGLGRIIGTNITEDLLSSIFSQFCIGK
ncbi:MAG: tRNA uridine-5-carboxymethylaminomethyl(34) synthesis GTPase MnmE [Chlamydiales bacterium]|nr:tRNA uridine-5-carboxymethylaminomethyl(34) synthesis GTPase MnmE [Chlamydiales bacterium]